jgi:acyl-coenzyme A synthetase/AMP-(fatty) acid ligase
MIAIKTKRHSINYHQLYQFTSQAITFFSNLGIREGQRVLIACSDDVLNLMITLSLMRMGVTTCLNHGTQNLTLAKDFDWLLSTQTTEHIAPNKFCLIDKKLVSQIKSESPHNEPDINGDLDLIILSSGTTGTHKKIGFSQELILKRVFKMQRMWGLHRSLNLMRLSTALGINHALLKIFLGDTVFLADSDTEAIDLIKEFNIKTLIASPIQLAQLMNQLGDTDLKEILDKVIYSGSMAHEKLLNNIRSKLSNNIHVLYGSTETGGVSCALIPLNNPLGVAGFLMPGVQVDIIHSSPEQEWGKVRIKAEHSVTQYLDDDSLNQEFFKDGWFYPGDEGRLINQNFLILNQRESDILNIGGVKLNPLIIENQIHRAYDFEDLAVFELILPSGQGVVALAYAAHPDTTPLSLEHLRQTLKTSLAPIQMPQYIFTVNQVPRNLAGKVLRNSLTEVISKNFLNEKK